MCDAVGDNTTTPVYVGRDARLMSIASKVAPGLTIRLVQRQMARLLAPQVAQQSK